MTLKLSPAARFGFDRLLDDGLAKARAGQKQPKPQAAPNKINGNAVKRSAVATKVQEPTQDLGRLLLAKLKPLRKPEETSRIAKRCAVSIAIK